MRPRIIKCYAEGRPGKWEAFCLDFDLVVQGSSFQDVYEKLDEQVALYLDGVKDLPDSGSFTPPQSAGAGVDLDADLRKRLLGGTVPARR